VQPGASSVAIWAPAFTMMLMSLLSYLDRNTLAVLAPTILRETHLNNEQYGFIISAFSIAYMIGNPVWGVVLDRIGLRRGMPAAVSIWTLASTLHAFVGSLPGFALVRGLLGFGEGATFPGGLRTVAETLPASQRSRGIAVAYSGGSLGAILAPLVVTPVALWYGWRAAFLLTGLAGLGWLFLWPRVARGISRSSSSFAFATMPKFWERRFWGIVFSYGLGALPMAFCLYTVPIYLSKVMGQSQSTIGKLLWIPPLGWEIGYFAWGWIADRVAHRTVRPVGLMGLLTLFSVPLAFVPFTTSVAISMAAFFFSMFVGAGFLILGLRYGMGVYDSDHVALVGGIGAGSWSALVALTMPMIGHLFDLGLYAQAFDLVTVIPVVGFAGWWWCSRGATQKPV
jgi:ACS family hexuronate transporter-like MFS transporter